MRYDTRAVVDRGVHGTMQLGPNTGESIRSFNGRRELSHQAHLISRGALRHTAARRPNAQSTVGRHKRVCRVLDNDQLDFAWHLIRSNIPSASQRFRQT